MAKKIELLHTTYDESGNIESQEVVHPLTSPNCIIMENGKTLDEVMGDGIATPTLTHEGTSFKVGVGDSNIEVVDGDVASMTLKGQSYQNILPKPTTLIMETDEQEFKINDKIDSNIIIDDNIAEIATVKGKTIVNTVQEESASEYTVLGEDLSGQSIVHIPEFINVVDYTDITMNEATEEIIDSKHYYTIKEGANVNSTYVTPQINNQFLYKPDTDYTIIVDIIENTTGKRLGISNYQTPIDYTNNTNSGRNFDNLTGISKLVVHTKSDLTQPAQGSKVIQLVYFGIWEASGDLSKHIKFNFMIIEGNHLDTDIPYFEPNGNIKGVTLQGQTLVNAIQEPCKDDYVVLGAEDGIEISAETGGCGTIEGTIGGSIKSAILKGNTLVNSWKKHNTYSPGNFTFHDDGFMELNNPVLYFDHIQTDSSLLKPNTKYLLIIEAKNNTIPVETYFHPDSRTVFSGAERTVLFAPKENGVRKAILTSNSDFSTTTNDMRWGVYISFAQANMSENERGTVSVRQMLIEYQEGMENWDIPYFEGMKSVQMPVLNATGKNLMPVSTARVEGITANSGGHPQNLICTNIPVVEGKTYRISGVATNSTNITKPVLYRFEHSEPTTATSHQQLYNQIGKDSPQYTFTVPQGIHYVSYTFGNQVYTNDGTPAWLQFDNIQLEEGSTATSFESYKSNILTVNELVELRGIGNVKDGLNVVTGELTQCVGKVVLDGSESWWQSGSTTETKLSVGINFPSFSPSSPIICNDLPNMTNTVLSDYGIMYDEEKALRINVPKTIAQNVEEFKQWLNSKNLIIYGKLEQPTIKTVDLTVTDQDGNTIPHIQTQSTVTHITASSDYLIPTVTIDNNLAYDTIIKPSTLYTVRFKHDTVNTDNPLTVNLGGTTQTVTSTEFTITTPSELAHNQLVFSGKNNVVSEVQVIEGDVTNIEYPFFEGMNDVAFGRLLATGKNLCKYRDNWTYNGLTFTTTNDGVIVNGTASEYVDYYLSTYTGTINVETLDTINKLPVGTKLYLSNNLGKNSYISYRINNGEAQYSRTVTTQDGMEILGLFVRFQKGDICENLKMTVQLERGSTATSYEPYKGVEVQQDVDSIPLTSDMFEQGKRERGMGMSLQQCPLTNNSARISSKTLIPVKPNGKYVVQGITSANHVWADMYNKDGLLCHDNVVGLVSAVIPHDVHYLLVQLKNADESAITPSDLNSMNLILQEVPQEIVLRGIGDVKDELDLTRGEYIQRIKEVELGDLTWLANSKWSGGDYFSCYCVLEIADRVPGMSDMIANKLKVIPRIQAIDSTQNVCIQECVHGDISSSPTLYVGIAKNKLGGYQLSGGGMKSYLKDNSITIQYVLATPIIHKVNLTNAKVIQSYATETHYETVTPSDSLIPNITIPSTLNYDVAIKPSTEYTIRANTSDNLTVDLGGAIGTLSNGKVTLTTPTTLTHNEVKFSGTGSVKELMVVEGNEIKDNVPFFNGMKDVQMGGIKLVNIARGARIIGSDVVSTNTNKTQFTYNGAINTFRAVVFDSSLLKPNTKYTIYLNITENTSKLENPIKFLYSGDSYFVDLNGTGIKKAVITTPDEIDRVEMAFRPCTTSQKIVVQNPMIIEGDWTHLDEIPSIESEMIIEQPIIRSQGKNLLDLETKYFNPSNVTYSKSGTTYTVVGNTSNYNYGQFAWTTETSAWFRNSLGKEVTLSVSSISCTNANSKACVQVRIACSNGTRVYKTISINDSIKYVTFTIPSNAIDMALQLMSNNTGSPLDSESTLTVSNIQLELGDTATSYEPYKHQTLYSNRVIGYEEGVHYGYGDGVKYTNANYNSVMADVEGLSIAYVTNGSSNFTFWDKDGVYISGKGQLDTALSLTDKNGFITVPSNAKYMRFACNNGNSSGVTDYHLKATVTGELPLRSLPNGVCDTLNLVTGEYVQRVGEVVLDGSEDWAKDTSPSNHTNFRIQLTSLNNILSPSDCMSDKFASIPNSTSFATLNREGIKVGITGLYISILNSKLETQDANGFKEYLSQNPITVQYELETPIVRKIGLTAKGNYTQSNLATDCKWGAAPTTYNNTLTTRYRTTNATSLPIVYNAHLFSSDFTVRYFNVDGHQDYEYISNMEYGQYVNVRRDKLEADTVEAFNKWLQHNPIEVGYITSQQSSESYSNIHKPIFFNNVNVQFLPRNLDIQPQLTLQARTRNSYVLDMAKPNTLYTVKAFSNPHNFYIDGKSFGKGTNGCITTPTLTNKLLVTGSSDVKELMIIEGDVTGKNLPYFKGILSSYHDVDEIEVYSVNKNLFDVSKVKPYDELGTYWWNTIIKENEVVSVRSGNIADGQFGAYATLDVRPNSVYTLYMEMEKDGEPYNGQIYGYENDKVWGNGTFTGYANTPYHIRTSQNAKYITIGFNYGKDFPIGTTFVTKNMRLYLGEESPIYIPHTHSTTLIEMPTRLETVKVVRPKMENVGISTSTGVEVDSATTVTSDFVPVQPKEFIHVRNGANDRAVHILCYDVNKNFVCYLHGSAQTNAYLPENCYFVRINIGKSNCSDLTITRQAWKPIQLNSLPNGVCDEIIMKPNSNKAQLVQRVGKVVLDGNASYENYSADSLSSLQGTWLYSVTIKDLKNAIDENIHQALNDNLNYKLCFYHEDNEAFFISSTNNRVFIRLHSSKVQNSTINSYMQDHPQTLYYELATPIIHEIQLKGYPHVYENGTVTLNTDTSHQTLVSYNVNQEQLINTQNETIIRHDQQIDDLYYYIEMYLEEIYQMELFRMKLELSL